MSGQLLLPDSRAKNPKGTFVTRMCFRDPATLTVKKVRIEWEPIYCFLCGKGPQGYVPMNCGLSFASWLCQRCSEEKGHEFVLHDVPDATFWEKMEDAMRSRFGRVLTAQEINLLAEQGRLGTALEALDRESPYRMGQRSVKS